MSDQTIPAVSTAKVPQPEYTAEKILERLVEQNRIHSLGINLLIAAAGGGSVPELTDRVLNGSINMLSVLNHLYQVRAVAAAKGYTDILEVLNQKLPYER